MDSRVRGDGEPTPSCPWYVQVREIPAQYQAPFFEIMCTLFPIVYATLLAASSSCMILPPRPDFCRAPLPHPQALQPQTLLSPLRANATLAMQASIMISFDYSDDDDVDLAAVPPPDPKWLRITVEGERAITQVSRPSFSIFPPPLHALGLQMFLPTLPLELLTDTRWDGWIATIQRPTMGRCNVSATQRQLLLDIALTYRAFTTGTAGVPDIWYTNFIRTLINIARSHASETIDGALVNLTSALRIVLPRVSLYARLRFTHAHALILPFHRPSLIRPTSRLLLMTLSPRLPRRRATRVAVPQRPPPPHRP